MSTRSFLIVALGFSIMNAAHAAMPDDGSSCSTRAATAIARGANVGLLGTLPVLAAYAFKVR